MNFHVRNLLNIGVLSGLTLIQPNQVLQYIELALTIAYSIFSFILSVMKYRKSDDKKVSKVEKVKETIKWLADALKDGKITQEEYKELKALFIDESKKEEDKDNAKSL